jgi:aspartate racemase
MKTIGVIGGISWQSTAQYYRLLNEGVQRRLGGSHSAKIVLASVDFHEIEQLQKAGDWERGGAMLAAYARGLEAAGADFLLIAANTMHKVAPTVQSAIRIPLVHVADVTGAAIKRAGLGRAGLLGTRYTMEQPFYRDRLLETQHLPTIVPGDADRATIHRIIYEELCRGILREPSREAFRGIISRLIAAGADSIILGCTEIALLVSQADSPVPVFDTTAVHCAAAIDMAVDQV